MESNNNKPTGIGKRFYASCSSCGHILGHAISGSDSEVDCPKCGAKINYKIAEECVTVILLSPSTKKPGGKSKGAYAKAYRN